VLSSYSGVENTAEYARKFHSGVPKKVFITYKFPSQDPRYIRPFDKTGDELIRELNWYDHFSVGPSARHNGTRSSNNKMIRITIENLDMIDTCITNHGL